MWYCGDDSDFWDCYWSLSMLLQWLRSLFLSGFLSTCHYLALSHIPWSNPLISNYIVHSTLLKSSNTSNTSFNFHFNPVLPFLYFIFVKYWITEYWLIGCLNIDKKNKKIKWQTIKTINLKRSKIWNSTSISLFLMFDKHVIEIELTLNRRKIWSIIFSICLYSP